jgi:hypothetical protein
VREHYLEWLSRARPELLALYAERFKRGSYQAKADQERISEIVKSVARPNRRRTSWHRGVPREPQGTGGLDKSRKRVEVLQLRPSGEQLRLV